MKTKKIALILVSVVLLAVLASCASMGEAAGVTGVWKYEDEESLVFISLTPDGLGVYESYEKYDGDKFLSYVEFGPYTDDGEELELEWGDYTYILEGSKLYMDGMEFKRTSRSAKNNTAPENLKGVWEDFNGGLIGISSGGFAISNPSYEISEFEADEQTITFDRQSYYDSSYAIVNSKLYVVGDASILSDDYCAVFTRKTSGGSDTTSKANLVKGYGSAGNWQLTDPYDDEYVFVYEFKSGNTYSYFRYDMYTNTIDDRRSGTFELDGHEIYLSENTDLAFAIIDSQPFMFTY